MAALPEAATPGLVPSLARLARSLIAHLRMRLQLLGLEIEQEKERLLLAVAALMMAFLFLGVTVVLLALAVIVHFWDTPDRLAAVLWLGVAAAVVTVGLGLFAIQRLRRPSTLFQASLAELVDDEAGFASQPDHEEFQHVDA